MRLLTLLSSVVLAQAVAAQGIESIPLKLANSSSSLGWRMLDFADGRPNQVKQSDGSILVQVNESASPLIYPLSSIRQVSGVRFRGKVSGLIDLPAGKRQGEAGADDFVLRVGLIVPGGPRPSPLKLRLTPPWIRELVPQLPGEQGLKSVRFFNVANSPGPGWESRTHPQSRGLIHEQVVLRINAAGEIEFEAKLPAPIDVAGLWIAADGDETSSSFQLQVEELTLID